MNKIFLNTAVLVLLSQVAFAQPIMIDSTMTGRECVSYGGDIVNTLNGQSCQPDEVNLGQVIGMRCQCICCKGDDVFSNMNDPVIDSAVTKEEALEGLNPACPQSVIDNLMLIDVLHYSTDGKIHQGQLLIDHRLVDDLAQVFQVMYDERFLVTSIIPVNRFGWDDDLSMSKNNTSGFNYRDITGGGKLSAHSYGFAIDINPLFNPYIKGGVTMPLMARYNRNQPGTLTKDHPVVKKFLELGWVWGGNWTSLKDYQHFEKVIAE